ncbi:hypothetical protein JCM8202_001872 [Rhodotorula sphaerocarpa]
MEAPEEDAEFLTLTQPVKGVTLRLSDTFYDQDKPCTAEPGHLLAVSSQYGWAVAASAPGGFGLYSRPKLRATIEAAAPHDTPRVEPHLAVSTAAPVDFLHFAMGERLVVAGLRDGSIAVWRLKQLVEGQASPLRTISAGSSALVGLCPNPAPDSPLLAVLSPNAPLTIYNLETASAHATFPADLAATSACWSVKGKQLVVGTSAAALVQLTPEGEQKAVVQAPADLTALGGAFEVRSVEWLENNVFLATYARPRTESEDDVQHEDEVYAITKVGSEVRYTKFADPCPPFGMMGRQGRRWVGRFRNWGTFKHLLVMVNAPSADIGVLAQAASYPPNSPTDGWAALALPEDTRPTMPPGDAGDDTCPLALELDLSAGGGKDPAVLVYTSRGALVYWTFRNERAEEPYAGLVTSRDILSEPEETESAVAAPAAEQAKPPAAAAAPSAFGAFASPAASTSAAAASPSGFGGFAAPGSTPAFGAPTPAPSAFGSSGFGSSTTSTPKFGATSQAPSAFGSAAPPAFGATSPLGFGAFGSAAKPTSPAASPFATSTATSSPSTPAAGSAFAAVPASGGFSAFGSGAGAGGSSASAGGFGFGAAAAGSAPKASPFGSGSAFGSAPAFGAAASSPSAAKSPAFGFGAGSSGTGGGFASFGGASSGGSTGFGAFGGGDKTGGGATPSAFASSAPKSTTAQGTSAFATAADQAGTKKTPKFAFGQGRSRDARGSDEEDDEGEGAEDEKKDRADEPPDLEPTKEGLDFAESVREAEKAGPPKREQQAAAKGASGTEALSGGFGSLGFGAGATASSKSGATSSVFGSAVPATPASTAASTAPSKPAFGFGSATATPAFGGGAFSFAPQESKSDEKKEEDKGATQPASAFGSGGFAAFGTPKSDAAAGTKPAFSFAPQPAAPSGPPSTEATDNDTPAAPSATSPAASPAASTAKPPAFSFAPQPTATAKPETEAATKPAGSAFSFGGTAAGGGFGAFSSAGAKSPTATTSKPVKTPEAEKRAAADQGEEEARPAPAADEEADEDEEEDQEEEGQDENEEEDEEDDEEEEEAEQEEASGDEAEDSADASGADDSDAGASDAQATPSKPAFSFGPSSGSASTAFPKPSASGGFGAFAGGNKSTGFGFGAAAPVKSPSATGFGFGGTTTPSPGGGSSTGFSFAPKAARSSTTASPTTGATASATDGDKKPTFSFAPARATSDEKAPAEAPKPAFSFAPKPTDPVAIPAAPKEAQNSTKSLFDFASSPPADKGRENGLLARLGEKAGANEEGTDGRPDDLEGQEDGEEQDDEESQEDEEEDEGEGSQEGSRDDEGRSEDEEEGTADEQDEQEPAPRAQPSLLSRLSPAASPTSSPAPDSSKPLAESAAFSFAPAKSAEPASPSAAAPAKPPTFSFAPSPKPASTPPASSTPVASTPTPADSGVPAKSPSFLNFTSTAPRSSSPLSAPPLAVPTSSTPTRSTSPLAPKPSLSPGLFGAGAAKPSFSFGQAPVATTPAPPKESPATPAVPAAPVAVPSAPSVASKTTAAAAAGTTPPSSAPKPADAKPEEPRALSVASAAVAKLGSQLIAAGDAPTPGVNEKGMSGEFLKAYLSVQQDLELLRKNGQVIKDFVDGLSRPLHAPLAAGTKPSLVASDWSFGDVDKLKQLTREAAPGVEALHAAALAQKRRIAELQSQLLKGETKREEAARFLRARSDPAFAKLVRVRQLGPEQTENQRKIRLQVEAVRSKIEQLEEHLLSLKKQLAKEKLGQSALQAPSLDSIQRAMRNITIAAAEKGLELDELTSKLERARQRNPALQPATPRQSSFGMSPLKAALEQSSILRESLPASPRPDASMPTPASAKDAAASALSQERIAGSLKKALLGLRASSPLVNRSACGSQTAQLRRPATEIQLAFSQGPITGDRLPRQRQYSPPRAMSLEAKPADDPKELFPAASPPREIDSSPAPAPVSVAQTSSSAPIFPSLDLKAAPTFSFANAGSGPAASAAFQPQPAATPSRGSASRHAASRAHAGAVQLKPTGSPSPSAASSFDWGPLPSGLTSTPTRAKPGREFISLSAASPPADSKAAPGAGPAPSFGFGALGGGTSTPAGTPNKPSGPGGFTFGGQGGSTTPAVTPSKPAAPAPGLGPFSFGTPATAPQASAPARAPGPASFSFGSTPAGAAKPPATAPQGCAPAPAPASFSFGPTPTSGTAKPPAPAMPAPASFSFGPSTTPSKPPASESSASFGTSPSSAMTTTGPSPPKHFGGVGAGFSVGATPAAPAPTTASATAPSAFSFAAGGKAGTGRGTEERGEEAGEDDDDEQGEGGDWDGEEDEEDEEGLDAISEHTEE